MLPRAVGADAADGEEDGRPRSLIREALRRRLTKKLAELVEDSAREEIDGGLLCNVRPVHAALDALERLPVEAEPAVRAVVR